jgi:hypothetical protein
MEGALVGVFGHTDSSSHFVGGAWRERLWIFFAGQSSHWKINLVLGLLCDKAEAVMCEDEVETSATEHITIFQCGSRPAKKNTHDQIYFPM